MHITILTCYMDSTYPIKNSGGSKPFDIARITDWKKWIEYVSLIVNRSGDVSEKSYSERSNSLINIICFDAIYPRPRPVDRAGEDL